MANVKISELPAAAALTGTEQIPLVQSGGTDRTTAQAIADLAGVSQTDVLMSTLARVGYAHAPDPGGGGGMVAVGLTAQNAASGGGAGPPTPDGSTALKSVLSQLVNVTSSSADLTAGYQFPGILVFRATTGNLGGFVFKCRLGITTNPGGQRYAIGLAASSLGQTDDPSTLINCFLLGKDAADANLSVMHNDGSGTATKVSIGPTLASLLGKLLDVTLSCDAAGTMSWEVMVVDDGTTYSGTVSTNVPATNAAMAAYYYVNSGLGSATDTETLLSKVFVAAAAPRT